MGKIKNIFLPVIVIVVLFFAYTYFFNTNKSEGALLSTDQQKNVPGYNLINLLLKMKSLKLDDSLFSNSLFSSLKDFGVTIQAHPIGRNNPFAPIGFDGGSLPVPTPAKTGTQAASSQ